MSQQSTHQKSVRLKHIKNPKTEFKKKEVQSNLFLRYRINRGCLKIDSANRISEYHHLVICPILCGRSDSSRCLLRSSDCSPDTCGNTKLKLSPSCRNIRGQLKNDHCKSSDTDEGVLTAITGHGPASPEGGKYHHR
ncbi:hypothetical protein AVEN_18271-1 [Araneus ventricosus]|uniref:Uncharacterized protein n=1 Tax=Araneus ventricosus TaxID=182803 RepID=A0A4Y2AIR7_ARAVE|nr:hypothetical protein AVEN_18271-1 [Araneus ventricosus]